jgi:hypothetical protein
MKLFVLIFCGLGGLFLAGAALLYVNEQSFLSRAEPATGIVTDLDRSDDGFCPVIDFTTRKGESVRYYANVCTSPPSYDLGDEVEVVYDPEDIKNVQMNGFWSQYVGVVVLGAIGLPLFLFGVWGAIPNRGKKS